MDVAKFVETQKGEFRFLLRQSLDEKLPAFEEKLASKSLKKEEIMARHMKLVATVHCDALRNQLVSVISELSIEVNANRAEILQLRGLISTLQTDLDTQSKKAKRKGKK